MKAFVNLLIETEELVSAENIEEHIVGILKGNDVKVIWHKSKEAEERRSSKEPF